MKIDPANLTSTARRWRLGFHDLQTVADLRREGMSGLSAEPGVYLALQEGTSFPRFSRSRKSISWWAPKAAIGQGLRKCLDGAPEPARKAQADPTMATVFPLMSGLARPQWGTHSLPS